MYFNEEIVEAWEILYYCLLFCKEILNSGTLKYASTGAGIAGGKKKQRNPRTDQPIHPVLRRQYESTMGRESKTAVDVNRT